MTTTTKFKSRKALLDCLRNVTALAGVSIGYNHVDNPAESISLGPTIQGAETEIRSHTQRPVKQEETYNVALVLFVGSKATIEANEARADELLEAIMTELADNYTLGNSIDGFQWARVAGTEIVSGEVVDEGPMCRVDLLIQCKGRI